MPEKPTPADQISGSDQISDSDPSAATAGSLVGAIAMAADAYLRVLAAFPLDDADGTACATVAALAAKVEKASSGMRVLAGARAVARGANKKSGVADPALWLARGAGTTTADAKGALELARSLDSHKETEQALLAGEVSVRQAQEVARSATEHPELERPLLDVARTSDLGALRSRARAELLARSDPESLHRRRHDARFLRHYVDADGMLHLQAALLPEVGLPLAMRLERHAMHLERRARQEGREPGRFDQRMADALVDLLSNGAPGTAGVRRTGRADLVIVCDLFAYRRGHAHGKEVCDVLGAGPIPVSVARDFEDDAFVKAVLHDGIEVHTVAHFGRHLKAELKTALDLGPAPQFPGRACADCGRTYGLERDHVDPVAHRGPTSLANLVDRCWPCHRDKTERDRQAGLLGRSPPRRGRTRPEPGPGPGPGIASEPDAGG